MKKFVFIFLILIISFGIVKTNQKKGEQLMVEAFNQSSFKEEQSDINTYSILDRPLNDLDEMEIYFQNVEKQIGAFTDNNFIKEESNQMRLLKKIYKSSDAELIIELKTFKSISNNSYLTINSILYNSFENLIKVKEQMNTVFENLNLTPKISINITGLYDGDMNYEQKKQITSSIMKQMNANFEEDYNTNKVYSVVGYTKLIDEYIYSEKQKININLALRYNEYENKTYLYLSSPIITTEY